MPEAAAPPRYDSASYFALAEEGLLSPDERTELLDGIIVAMAPQSPLHAAAISCLEDALRQALPAGTLIRIQMPFVAGAFSVPEPDLAVVRGSWRTYVDRHPSSALLVVEVAFSTAAQDRLTKAAIYASAGVTNYWIVHAGAEKVEAYGEPNLASGQYTRASTLEAGAVLHLDELPGVEIACEQLFPRRAR